jgi:hypothetical protein
MSHVQEVDIRFVLHGSVVLIHGLTTVGQEWLDENLGSPETQYWGDAIAAEPRYCGPILYGAQVSGLEVEVIR